MGAAAAIIVKSRKMWHLFEGGYHSSSIIVRTRRVKWMKLLFQQHCAWAPCLQDSVDLVFGRDCGGWRGSQLCSAQAIADGVAALLLIILRGIVNNHQLKTQR